MKTCKNHPDREVVRGRRCSLCLQEYHTRWRRKNRDKKPVVSYEPYILILIKTQTNIEAAKKLGVTRGYVDYVARKNGVNFYGKKRQLLKGI